MNGFPDRITPGTVYARPLGDLHSEDEWQVLRFGADYTIGDRFPPERAGHASANSESDVLAAIEELERDEIDDLVDDQLRQERSGYDHCINQPKRCPHCHEEAHTVPIKQRMQEVRSLWHSTIQYYEDGERVSEEAVAALNAYRYDEDDSEIVCWGEQFVGPKRPTARILRATERERQISEYLAGDPSCERLRSCVQVGTYFGSEYVLGCFYAGLPLPDPEDDTTEWTVSYPFGPFAIPAEMQYPRPLMHLWDAQWNAIEEAFSAATWYDIVLGPPCWYRFVDNDPDVRVEINTELEQTDSWSITRSFISNVRHRLTVSRRHVRSEEFDLFPDPATGSCVVRRLTDDGRQELEVFLRSRPTIGEWVEVEPEQAEVEQPRNRRQRRGHRESSEPMWTQRLGRRQR